MAVYLFDIGLEAPILRKDYFSFTGNKASIRGGQRCMALSVLVLVGPAREWIDDIVESAKNLKIGPGWEEGIAVGPLVSTSSKLRVEEIIEEAVDSGADLPWQGRLATVLLFSVGQ